MQMAGLSLFAFSDGMVPLCKHKRTDPGIRQLKVRLYRIGDLPHAFDAWVFGQLVDVGKANIFLMKMFDVVYHTIGDFVFQPVVDQPANPRVWCRFGNSFGQISASRKNL